MTDHDANIEQRSLRVGKWANLFMACAGVTVALLANASALMLDGLFSGVNFLAAIFATRVAASVQRLPDEVRPFGYEIDEAVYVMFRSLVLMGVILVAAFMAANKIFLFAMGEVVPAVKLHWVSGYMVLILTICMALAAWHHHNWKRTGRRSGLLHTERTSAILDGVLSLTAGIAFLLISLLKGTPLDFLVPISDSIVILCLAAYMIPQPWGMFRGAMKEVLGESDSPAVRSQFIATCRAAGAKAPFELVDLAVTKMGRSRFAVAYLKPQQAVTAAELEAVKQQLLLACRQAFAGTPLRMEFLFTGAKDSPALADLGVQKS